MLTYFYYSYVPSMIQSHAHIKASVSGIANADCNDSISSKELLINTTLDDDNEVLTSNASAITTGSDTNEIEDLRDSKELAFLYTNHRALTLFNESCYDSEIRESKGFLEIITELTADIWLDFTMTDGNHQTGLLKLVNFHFLNQTPLDECNLISLLGDNNQIIAAN